ncbi:PREDICTED: glycerol-3-phosphate dehydrogenase, mitochondrial-like [Branchiostoma belcheri]|uniref:Glycerol-3-phosphate dehydrogenase n=1 Tax=Branchiostoma belcheri TaxID=7741 RepID=A0A6P5A9C7_BRABE|nr:PREDICTED: glycerol-3-phosphate dehydrogenase, mitochondrial-like [Branchiostoma belcheri]
MSSFWSLRRTLLAAGGAAGTVYAFSTYSRSKSNHKKHRAHVVAADTPTPAPGPLPTRVENLRALQETPEFDVLVIGGGATGCGVALDAVTRGLRTALVERDDFSAGTSSRSTKLIHGGVRYLQKAIMGLDKEQYNLVKEALHERANLLEIAPHLSGPLPIMLPVYRWWQLPYFWAGIKAYDLVAGSQCVKSSYMLTKSRALELFPMLKKDRLVGAIVYYDGQHNDARMNLAIALSAARHGATVANHMEVKSLTKTTDDSGKEVISGAVMKDCLTGQEITVKAKCVVNATGPFTDGVRQMDNAEIPNICQPSAGVHIILPDYYSPESMGLLDPSTSDGRVIFFLPWAGLTIAGTTDSPCDVTHNPTPTEKEIQFILNEIKNYLSPDVSVRRGDVLAAWSGIRPLVSDPNSKNTQSISRNHVIEVSPSNLVTIAGGKWTTYRSMASDTVDKAIEVCSLQPRHKDCQTDGLMLEGGDAYTPTMFIRLVQDFGLENEVAQHLAHTYGDKAFDVAKLAQMTGKRWPVVGKRLVEDFPYLEAEVKYAAKEYACTAIDVIARRTRLAFQNVQAAETALPTIIRILGQELGWNKQRCKEEEEAAKEFLYMEMGGKAHLDVRALITPDTNLPAADIERYTKRFNKVAGAKGFITHVDLGNIIQNLGIDISDDQLHDMLEEVDTNRNGQVELDEFLQLMNAAYLGYVTLSRLDRIMALTDEMVEKKAIPTHRSGGGV